MTNNKKLKWINRGWRPRMKKSQKRRKEEKSCSKTKKSECKNTSLKSNPKNNKKMRKVTK